MFKNSKVVLFVTLKIGQAGIYFCHLKSWSGRKILDPSTYSSSEGNFTVHAVYGMYHAFVQTSCYHDRNGNK